MRRTLEERLLRDPEITDNLLNADRPLGAFKPKIDMLYLLGGIDRPTRRTLKGIAGIRNFFAHDLTASFSSTDKKFVSDMKRLTLHTGRTHYPHHLAGGDSEFEMGEIDNNQDCFRVNLKLGLIELMRDRMRHHEYTNIPLTEDELQAKFPHLREPS